jgi:hypothetical protein
MRRASLGRRGPSRCIPLKYLFLLCCVLRGRVPMLAQYCTFVLAPLGNAFWHHASSEMRAPGRRPVSKVARERLPRAVFALGAVSFLTDLGSEMILPLLPVLLAEIGGSMQQLGLLQGISEFVVAGMKLASGWLSDASGAGSPGSSPATRCRRSCGPCSLS